MLLNIRDLEGTVDAVDVDGDTLTYTVQMAPQHGSVVIDDAGKWHYRADAAYNGEDSAVIAVDDGNGGVATATLNFTVEGYLYEGSDLVIDDRSGDNSLVMEGVNKDELAFTRSGDDLLMAVRGDEATVTFKSYFADVNAGVETIETAQGVISLSRDVSADVSAGFLGFGSNAEGSEGVKNLLNGSTLSNTISGAERDDVLFGFEGYDSLYGYAGDDTIVGGSGGDTIRGGIGDDTLYGDAGTDYLYGDEGADALIGGSEGDYLYGGTGDDWLSGGAGNDTLKGEDGSDTLYGGSGNDYLYGGGGDDTYRFERGDGNDTLLDHKSTTLLTYEDAGYDTVRFGEGITRDDVTFVMQYGSLEIQYGDGDRVTVNNQSDEKDKIERLELSDGSYLSHEDIELVVQSMNAYAQENGIYWMTNDTVRNTEELMAIVSASWKS